jgi:hypothetical protein
MCGEVVALFSPLPPIHTRRHAAWKASSSALRLTRTKEWRAPCFSLQSAAFPPHARRAKKKKENALGHERHGRVVAAVLRPLARQVDGLGRGHPAQGDQALGAGAGWAVRVSFLWRDRGVSGKGGFFWWGEEGDARGVCQRGAPATPRGGITAWTAPRVWARARRAIVGGVRAQGCVSACGIGGQRGAGGGGVARALARVRARGKLLRTRVRHHAAAGGLERPRTLVCRPWVVRWGVGRFVGKKEKQRGAGPRQRRE